MTKTIKLAEATEPVVRAPKKADLDKYVLLVAKKAKLEADARKLDKEIKAEKERLLLYAESEGGETERCGYRIAAVEGAKYPAWREEYEKAMGALRTQEVIEATIPATKLIVEKV